MDKDTLYAVTTNIREVRVVRWERNRVIVRLLASMPPDKKIKSDPRYNVLSVPLALGLRDWWLGLTAEYPATRTNFFVAGYAVRRNLFVTASEHQGRK